MSENLTPKMSSIAKLWKDKKYSLIAFDKKGEGRLIERDETVDEFGQAKYESYIFADLSEWLEITKEEVETYIRSW